MPTSDIIPTKKEKVNPFLKKSSAVVVRLSIKRFPGEGGCKGSSAKGIRTKLEAARQACGKHPAERTSIYKGLPVKRGHGNIAGAIPITFHGLCQLRTSVKPRTVMEDRHSWGKKGAALGRSPPLSAAVQGKG